MPKTPKKRPMDMTDVEALKHLFHPDIVKAVQTHLKGQTKPAPKRRKGKTHVCYSTRQATLCQGITIKNCDPCPP